MKNLPKKKYPERTHCIDCNDEFNRENSYKTQGRIDSRCIKCRRKYINKVNKKRYKALKESKWF